MLSQPVNPTAEQHPVSSSFDGTHFTNTSTQATFTEASSDIKDYLQIFLRHRWLVLTVLVTVFVATLVISFSLKPVYMASGRLQLSIHGPKVTKFEDINALANQIQTKEFMQTQAKLLQSESLAARVIKKLSLDKNPAFRTGWDQADGPMKYLYRLVATIQYWMSPGPGVRLDPDISMLSAQQKVVGRYLKNLAIQPERDTTIVSLSFKSEDASLARDIINTMIQEFIAWDMDKNIEAAGSAKQQLEKQLQLARIQLEKSESDLNTFAQKAGIVSLDSNLNLIYRQLDEMNRALAVAETERIGKEALFRKARKENIGSMSLTLENELIQRLREEHIKLDAEYRELYTTFKDDYPKLKNLKSKLTDVEKRITEEELRILNSIATDYATALEKENSLKREAEAKKALALELNAKAVQYKILEREVETNKQIHLSLLERAKEIDANVGTELGKIQVVDFAGLPLKPHSPNIPLNLLIGALAGLIGGLGLALLVEHLDNSVKSVEEISDRFQIPVLAVLPTAESGETKDLDFLVRMRPKAGFSESVRTAKVSIELSSSMDEPLKSLMITSTSPGEGKSTISCNIAQVFAGAEEKVVIVDADLRKPRLHKTLLPSANGNGGCNGSRSPRNDAKRNGLSHYLSGICKVDDLIQQTSIPGLSFISAGPVPPNPSELLTSSRMKELLRKLREQFDRVILDAPPAIGFSDVLVIANQIDGVVLISTLGQTHREALRIFRRSISNVNGNLLGSIVNKLDIDHHYGKYYHNYSRHYDCDCQPALHDVAVPPAEHDEK